MSKREFAIIEQYFKSLSKAVVSNESDTVVVGPGDDCAILRVPEGMELCVSTDTLLEGIHFLPESPASVVIARTMGANLSDLAAMGANPFAFLLALTLPEAQEDWLEEFTGGLTAIVERHQIPLVGGNLSKGPLSLTVTVMGTVPIGRAVKRTGSTEGDDIYVTGTLGDAAQGLVLSRAGEIGGYLVGRYQFPAPRIAAGTGLRDIATSMIDISDGLVAEVGHLTEAGELGAAIIAADLPLSKELVADAGMESATQMALFAGDDYELCFTANPSDAEAIQKLSNSLNLPMTRIGVITNDGEILIRDSEGAQLKYQDTGYEHF